jgi:sugar/nucleoside kinase (ribokinase family)
VIALGELLVEVMRQGVDQPLSQSGEFIGPFPSGAPAIFADAVARLGVSTGFVGVIGASAAGEADAFGCCVLERLREDHVDTTYVRVAPGYTTGTAFVAYRSNGERDFVFHLSQAAAALLEPGDVHADYVAGAQFLHVTGSALATSESARQACYKAIEICKGADGRVSFDPNLRPELLEIGQVRELCEPVLAQCDLLLPSGPEAVMLADLQYDEDAACRHLIRRGISIVALKRGDKGSTVYSVAPHTDRIISMDAPPLLVEEIDPTGAGDCYGGAFVVGLLEGWPLSRVARFANIAGALSVTRKGPMEGAPYRQEVLACM